jgi:hypothetical protein
MAHCAKCPWGDTYREIGMQTPCPGCGHEAEIAALTAERDVLLKQVDAAEASEKEALADFKAQFLRVKELLEDLKALSETLQVIQSESPSWSINFALCNNALARPGVRSLLSTSR